MFLTFTPISPVQDLVRLSKLRASPACSRYWQSESDGNHRLEGDHHHSFGLFQLNDKGIMGDLTKEQAFNPETNTRVAVSQFQRKGDYRSPGDLAAAAQRPKNKVAYARKVNARQDEARALLDA